MLILIYFLINYIFPSWFTNKINKVDQLDSTENSSSDSDQSLDNADNHNLDNQDKKCLVIAHPDDEVMFFSPLILNLSLKQIKLFRVVCLTNGSTQREQELEKCLSSLSSGCFNYKSQLKTFNLPDSMSQSCRTDYLKHEQLVNHIHSLRNKNYSFYTFDSFGVSDHVNHKDCYNFLLAALLTDKIKKIHTNNLPKIEQIWKHNINRNVEKVTKKYKFRLFTLKSYNIIGKYVWPRMLSEERQFSEVYYSREIKNWQRAYFSFKNGHESQVRWFRHFWFFWSRYLYCNDFERVY